METKHEKTMKRSYDDFEPLCRWQREDGCDTVELHLQGFKKEQLKVHRNHMGIVTITGERPLDDNRWSRFCKEIKATKDYKTNEIRAKFGGGILHVSLPKKTPIPRKSSGTQNTSFSARIPFNCLFCTESSRPRLTIDPKLAFRVAVELALVVAFVAYAYKYFHGGSR